MGSDLIHNQELFEVAQQFAETITCETHSALCHAVSHDAESKFFFLLRIGLGRGGKEFR
jgi:hypothetical protein